MNTNQKLKTEKAEKYDWWSDNREVLECFRNS